MRALLLSAVAVVFLSPARARAADDDPWFGRDKALHFGASAVLALGGYALGAAFFDETPPRLATGAGVALGAGIAKELADLAGAGSASWRDIVWDVAGTGTGLLLAWGADELLLAPAGARGSGDAKLLAVRGRF